MNKMKHIREQKRYFNEAVSYLDARFCMVPEIFVMQENPEFKLSLKSINTCLLKFGFPKLTSKHLKIENIGCSVQMLLEKEGHE